MGGANSKCEGYGIFRIWRRSEEVQGLIVET